MFNIQMMLERSLLLFRSGCFPRIDSVLLEPLLAVSQPIPDFIFLSITVVDGGGHLSGFLRMEGVLLASVGVSQVKARTTIYFGTATKNLPSHSPIAGVMADAVSFPIALLAGGVPIQLNGQIVGGIGVGGGSGEQDDMVAQADLSVFS